MGKVKYFDIVTMVTDEATNRFSPLFKENKENKDILKEYCDYLDAVAEEFDAESCSVEVDEQTHEISISTSYPDIVLETGDHPMIGLIDRAVRVRFSHGDGETATITLTYPSIWDKA